MNARLILPTLLATALVAGWGVAQTTRNTESAEIHAARREAAQALGRAVALEAQAAQAADEASRAQTQSLALAERIGVAEANISAAEARLRTLSAAQDAQRARLAEKQAPVVRLTAMLQTMARRPAALALVQPGSIDDVAHVRALLASTLPVIRQRTAALQAEIDASAGLRDQARAAAADLTRYRRDLQAQRNALAALERRERTRSRDLSALALTESDRALALGEDAGELAASRATQGQQARIRAALAALPEPIPRPGTTTPAPRTPLRYALPVAGRLITGTGEVSDAGVHARGLLFESAGNAPVSAPAAGRIAYAGGFRRYGEIVIIDHGDGWTSLITGLASTGVRVGERVGAGAPIGRARSNGRPVGVELRHRGQPVAITPLLEGSAG